MAGNSTGEVQRVDSAPVTEDEYPTHIKVTAVMVTPSTDQVNNNFFDTAY
jgi:hypothetical protein